MAKIHVLAANLKGAYKIVAHIAVLSGNNSANKTWKSVLLAANLTGDKAKTRPHATIPGDRVYNASVLETGENGHSWQISSAELAELVAGDKIELSISVPTKGNVSLAEVELLTDAEIIALVGKTKLKYKYYGLVHTP